jgi:mono/diheme cytochrome c family protein
MPLRSTFSLMVMGIGSAGLSLMAFGAPQATGRASPQPLAPRQPTIATRPAPAAPTPAPAHTAATLPVADQNALFKQYCVTCHSDRGKAGGLTLASFDAAGAVERAEVSEKIIRKLRAGMMPPAGARRPEGSALADLATALEAKIDQAAALNPNPGRRPFQRLNRAEYSAAVRDLLGLDVDVEAYLPPDTISDGFDNVADAQGFSPTVLEGYLRAASAISTLAIGDVRAAPTEANYKVPRTANQMRQVEGAPFGTRGGIAVTHIFPADGEYTFRMMLHSIPTGQLFGSSFPGEQIEVSINGARVALLDINTRMSESDPNGMNLVTPRIYVKAGPQRVAAAFVSRFDAPVDDLLAPIEHTMADSQIGSGFGITALPHLREFAVTGPIKVTGVSESPSRKRIFSCRPTASTEESACATEIVKRLAALAYRNPVSNEDVRKLMMFYEQGRKEGDFEEGVRMSLQAMLASPKFLFRLEEVPAGIRPGQNYRISDYDLASRLSFFIWGSGPDQELLKLAGNGTLRQPVMLEKQVQRMLKDPRSEALGSRFAAQWLRLQDLVKLIPDYLQYPMYDRTLADALKRETELFFDSLVRDDRPIQEMLTAEYTFANERVAKHYNVQNVTGPEFRRVEITDPNRRGLGLLGHGSLLALTSVADRTSPVQRGKWIMEVLLGSPPPPPPPNVPTLDESVAAAQGAKVLSVRQRMEEHRKNPACNSCHRVIDPLGLALENFDVTGAWRIHDGDSGIDASGDLYDGTKMQGPKGLRDAILRHQDVFMLSYTESLMTYALGRRVEFYDLPTIRTIVRDAGKADYRMSQFILGVVKSPAFQMGRLESAETTTEAAR